MKHTIELEPEQIDAIVISGLHEMLDDLNNDYIRRKDGRGVAIWDCDLKKDLKQIKKHTKALKLILKYYGETL